MNEPSPDPGVAGGSARREAERKRERRLQRTPQKSGIGRMVASLVGPSANDRRQIAEEKHWTTGADGERRLAESLARSCPNVLMLHDRRMPSSRANIDHIGIAPTGVYVIDAKRYRGKIEVVTPLFGAPKLKIAGRDRTKLVDGLAKQVGVVQRMLKAIAPDVRVHGCLCFIAPEGFLADVGLPVLRTLKINGYSLYCAKRLAKRLNRQGPVGTDQARALHAELQRRLPPA